MASVEGKRWLCVDPGETTGWSVWQGEKLLGGGQTPLWEFAHDLWDALQDNAGPLAAGADADWFRLGVVPPENRPKGEAAFDLIVCEKFALYPWEAKNLAFDEFRTVQLIGALCFMATLHDIEFHKQPASIKERALAGGAKELFVRPLHENRHTNDSAMHGVFYIAVECKGINLGVKDGAQGGVAHHAV